jgi:hypothetical protein
LGVPSVLVVHEHSVDLGKVFKIDLLEQLLTALLSRGGRVLAAANEPSESALGVERNEGGVRVFARREGGEVPGDFLLESGAAHGLGVFRLVSEHFSLILLIYD